MSKQHIPTYGYYIIGGFILILVLTISGLKIQSYLLKSERLTKIENLERQKREKYLYLALENTQNTQKTREEILEVVENNKTLPRGVRKCPDGRYGITIYGSFGYGDLRYDTAEQAYEDVLCIEDMHREARSNKDEYNRKNEEELERRIKALPPEKRIIIDILDAAIEEEKSK